MLLNCGFGEDSWESLGLQGDSTSPFWRKSVLGVLLKEWCYSWKTSTLATSCEELTHWKKLWCSEGLGAGGEGDDRGWDGWWHHWLDGRGFGWTPGVGDGQGGRACCDSWSRKESDVTERLNWTEWLMLNIFLCAFCHLCNLLSLCNRWSAYSNLLPIEKSDFLLTFASSFQVINTFLYPRCVLQMLSSSLLCLLLYS